MSIKFKPLTQVFNEAIDILEKRANGELLSIPTFSKKFNKISLGGLSSYTTVSLGARSGGGKSSFSNFILFTALDNLKLHKKEVLNNIRVLYWSFEMPAWSQIVRSLTSKTNKSYYDLMTISKKDKNETIDFIKKYKNDFDYGNKVFITNDIVTPEDIYDTNKIVYNNYLKNYNKKPFILNLIDHTRLLKSKNGQDTQENMKIFDLYTQIHRTKLDFGTCNIVLSQFNRNIESPDRRKDLIPNSSDFYGSDSVYHFSDICLGLISPKSFNKNEYLKESDIDNLLTMWVIKNRDGEIGYINYDSDFKHHSYKERDNKEQH